MHPMPKASPGGTPDPIFAAAAAEVARQQTYRAKQAADHREVMRLRQVLWDAAHYKAGSEDLFVVGWAGALADAARALGDAGLADLMADDPDAWMPRRLATAALRRALEGDGEAATRDVVGDAEHREGVRTALDDICDEAECRLRLRLEADRRRTYPDLEPAEPEPCPVESETLVPDAQPAGYDSRLDRLRRGLAELPGRLDRLRGEWALVAHADPSADEHTRNLILVRAETCKALDWVGQLYQAGYHLHRIRPCGRSGPLPNGWTLP